MQNQSAKPILVTGATGYIASGIIKLLLEKDFKVRGTVRSLANKDKNAFLYNLVPEKSHNLELVEADLGNRASWETAIDGCEYVYHVASPVMAAGVTDENEIIGPAVAGTENVLEIALEKGVKKVVITSSCSAVWDKTKEHEATEEDWADETQIAVYAKSKVRSERRAWEIYEKCKDRMQISVILPSFVLGPVYSSSLSSSDRVVADMMKGLFPGVVEMKVGVTDIRDVAEAHYKAMTSDVANGKRYIISGRQTTMLEIVQVLKKEFEKLGYNISDKFLSAEEVLSSDDPTVKELKRFLGPERKVSNELSIKELGLRYRPYEETLIDMGNSLIKQNITPGKND